MKNNEKDIEKIYLKTLSFEITRKCNLKCNWCAKGEAQNLSISKEIVDKTLDEVSNMYIDELRITGGEPLLNLDGILYLADKIIEKQIKINTVFIPTNGTIQDSKIAKAFKKLSLYCLKIDSSFKKDYQEYKELFPQVPIYKNLKTKKVICAISTFEHSNGNKIKETIDYYNKNVNCDSFAIVSQSTAFSEKFPLIIEGFGASNYKKYSSDYLKNGVRIIDDKFCIITDDNTPSISIINKTVSVAVNGNVYVGCLSSYEREDIEYMFNIMNCYNNFYNLIDNWCWENPINRKVHLTKEAYLGYKWLKHHNLCDENLDRAYQKINMDLIISEYEKHLKETHKRFVYLKHYEVDLYTICKMYLMMNNCTNNEKEMFLLLFSMFDDEMIQNIIYNDTEYRIKFRNTCYTLERENRKRNYRANKI